MDLQSLIRVLGGKYDESRIVPPTTMKSAEGLTYRLNRLDEDTFRNYYPRKIKDDFRVVAVDGGSATLFDTPYWGVGFVKLRARFISFDVNAKKAKTMDTRSEDAFVLFLTDETKSEGSVVSRESYEKGMFLSTEETLFTARLVDEGLVGEEDLLLADGTLVGREELCRKHEHTVGVSKRSGLCINRYSASSYLTLKAREFGRSESPWYAHPLVAEY
ncbi:MAG: hypothetical protein JW834_03505, partial [Candidatus Diapherotrites archaeon]|nr:hypothetical protein [Candidatus Diapherotrites archaeon]